jgi:hypothetical protein
MLVQTNETHAPTQIAEQYLSTASSPPRLADTPLRAVGLSPPTLNRQY